LQLISYVSEDAEPSILDTPSTLHDPLWYLDTGASHHFTHDNSNFTTKALYTGFDMVKINNNSGLPIENISSVVYTTPHTNTKFSLNNLLHVHAISKYLLIVFKVCKR